MILNALDQAGGEKYLLAQAHDNPTAFMTLIGKVLPTTLTGTGSGGAIDMHSKLIVEIVRPEN